MEVKDPNKPDPTCNSKVDTRITDAVGKHGILIADFPEQDELEGLPFTEEDQDIYFAAGLVLIESHRKMLDKIKNESLSPKQIQAEKMQLKREFMENIKGMSKPKNP